MKPLFWVGLVVLVLGIASFFVAIPQREHHGVEIGDASIGVETRSDRKIPMWGSGLLVVGGIALMLGSRRGARAV